MRHQVRTIFNDVQISLYERTRRDFDDPLQKALEDIVALVHIDENNASAFEDDLMDGFLIISEHPQGANDYIIVYKLSDLGIDYIKLGML